MNKEEILELFRITSEKVAQIHREGQERITAIRDQNEKEVAAIEKEIVAIRAQAEEEKREKEKEITLIRTQIEEEKREKEKELKRISQYLGNYTRNVADIAEEYFYQSLSGNPSINKIHFDEVLKNEKYGGREYDIVMYNTQYIALVSVKTNLRSKHISNLLHKDLPALQAFYKRTGLYQRHKLIGVAAGLNYKKEVIAKASQLGVYVLTQSENNQAKLLNANVSPKFF